MEQVVSYELHKNMQINFTFLNPTILTQMDHDSGQMEHPPGNISHPKGSFFEDIYFQNLVGDVWICKETPGG